MKRTNIEKYKDKKITIFLKNRYYYTGHIVEFLDDSIKFFDKFGNVILISINEITAITERRNEGVRTDGRRR